MERLRADAEKDLRGRIDVRRLTEETRNTGIYVTPDSPLLAR
jgi:hypothetical protein